MKDLTEFVICHLNDDTSRLILDRGKYPRIDMDLAVTCIESRRKLKGKIQEWYDEPGLIFPVRLSAEQCSSSATGKYKAEVAEKIMGSLDFARNDRKKGSREKDEWSIMDMTGGLGVDSWFFSKKASKVIYCEMQEPLCKAARHNFQILKAENITVNNILITPESCRALLTEHNPDIVYIDPARRGEGGRKVFLIEDCTPDVLTLKDEIFKHVRHILIKLSPMADITMFCQRLGSTCREVHVVAAGGECKELLIWMDREWNNEPAIISVEIQAQAHSLHPLFRFTVSEEKTVQPTYEGRLTSPKLKEGCQKGGIDMPPPARGCPIGAGVNGTLWQPDYCLFEPGKALMKAAPFNLIASRFGICKLGRSTHYYMTDNPEKAEELKRYGKVFRIVECLPLDKRNIKEIGKRYPKAEVTARNIPMDTDTLRKKLGVTSGDDAHIFGLKSDAEGNLLIIAERI